MRQGSLTRQHAALLKGNSLRGPRALYSVVILDLSTIDHTNGGAGSPYLIIRDWYGLVDNVSDSFDLGLQDLLLLGGGSKELLLLVLKIG